jgi:hypothetical protein
MFVPSNFVHTFSFLLLEFLFCTRSMWLHCYAFGKRELNNCTVCFIKLCYFQLFIRFVWDNAVNVINAYFVCNPSYGNMFLPRLVSLQCFYRVVMNQCFAAMSWVYSFFPYWIYSWSTSEDLDVNNFLVFMFKFLKSHLVIKSSMSISVLASFAFLILLRCQLLIVPSDVLAYTTRSCWFEKQVFYTAAFFDRWFSKKWSWWHWYYP